jgi:hypothetical protein
MQDSAVKSWEWARIGAPNSTIHANVVQGSGGCFDRCSGRCESMAEGTEPERHD